MLNLLNRFFKPSVVILAFLVITFSHAHDDIADEISILDIDASGEVDAMTDGLLMMRSMFGFTDDVLVDGAVSANCTECDSAQIQEHISQVRSMTISQFNSAGVPGPTGPQGEKGEKGDTGAQGPKGDAGADSADITGEQVLAIISCLRAFASDPIWSAYIDTNLSLNHNINLNLDSCLSDIRLD